MVSTALSVVLLGLLCVLVTAVPTDRVHVPTISLDSPPSAASTTLDTLTSSAPDPYAGWLHGLIPPGQPHWQPGRPRPPGTLLLNMLTKNEAEHLNRTLPLWAAVIDYWIIGVDDANSDASEAVIHRHLGHLPGRIVTVHFTGMGPTWTLLVEAGLQHFPMATHGIIADADFAPMSARLDRMQLDVRCSKHMYTVYTEDHMTSRRMDWIYRNLRNVSVTRRTHQILNAPALPSQEVFQTLIDLSVDEREGGFQDRSGEKDARYIRWLELDLLDYPDDPRTLYYLAYAHLNLFLTSHAAGTDSAGLVDANLSRAIGYFERRAAVEGNFEERWFAVLKLGEVYERFLRDWATAERWYREARERDGDRADPAFYLGQHYRLAGAYEEGWRWLVQAARLPRPSRSLFQWELLYQCLRYVELAEAATRWATADRAALTETLSLLSHAHCETDAEKQRAVHRLLGEIRSKLAAPIPSRPSSPPGGAADRRVKAVKAVFKEVKAAKEEWGEGRSVDELETHVQVMRVYLKEWKGVEEASRAAWSTCRRYRQATSGYLKWWKRQADALPSRDGPAYSRVLKASDALGQLCR